MKKISVLALVLAFTMMLSVVSFAAPAYTADDAVYADNTPIAEGYLEIEAGADSIGAKITDAVAGNYYGIILVTGDALPNANNTILYINQATAPAVAEGEKSVVDFDVLPIDPTTLEDENDEPIYTLGAPLTLYISSNVAGAKLIKVPLVYDEEKAAYTLGDVNNDTVINGNDVLGLVQYVLNKTPFEADDAAADVNADGAINGNDVLSLVQYVLNKTPF